MNDISFSEMQEVQKELQAKYYKEWGGLSPEKAKNRMLYMMTEAVIVRR
ncbi:MAG: hypothetical protein Q4E74_01175 [Ruminococcus sp.]|nr:hypothetical protein [Ruminococcus sp.]